jgi:hypothetical protein
MAQQYNTGSGAKADKKVCKMIHLDEEKCRRVSKLIDPVWQRMRNKSHKM